MKILLLSGGSGKRLWPLSGDNLPKQFLNIFGSEKKSMIQNTWNLIKKYNLERDTYIITGKNYVELLRKQIDIEDNHIIREPSMRDTFPAILLASSYLFSKENSDINEPIIVIPVDLSIDESFLDSIFNLCDNLNNHSLGLLGIKPTFPSEKYGYIVPKVSIGENLWKVSSFREKPNKDTAKKLISNRAMWNSGVFIFKIKELQKFVGKSNFNYQSILHNYERIPKNSFDYVFSEKQNDIIVFQHSGIWNDLGTWNDLLRILDKSALNQNTYTLDSHNVQVYNKIDIPIGVIGLDNIIIAVTDQGILISNSEKVTDIKYLPDDLFKRKD